MSCGCGAHGYGRPPSCGDPCPPRALIPVGGAVRDLNARFGMRPYVTRWVFTSWSGGARGVGEEFMVGTPENILPPPLLLDLQTLTPVVSPIGLSEQGGVLLTEVSGCYTEEQLRGAASDGSAVPADQSFYYEVEFLRADGAPGEKRRFSVDGVPVYMPDDVQWQVRVARARPDPVPSP